MGINTQELASVRNVEVPKNSIVGDGASIRILDGLYQPRTPNVTSILVPYGHVDLEFDKIFTIT